MVFFPALLFWRQRPLLAANDVAFAVLFGIFIVALLTLIVIVAIWVIRRDRQGRAAWLQRQQDRSAAPEGDVPPPAGP
jgi:type VI protein secretion system component VasK